MTFRQLPNSLNQPHSRGARYWAMGKISLAALKVASQAFPMAVQRHSELARLAPRPSGRITDIRFNLLVT